MNESTELQKKIYDILYENSNVDMTRILHEDVWPIDKLESLIKERERLAIETYIKPYLEACQEANGLPYCKNCGLGLEQLPDETEEAYTEE